MAASDAIVIGESWISEHYFTSESAQSFQAKVIDRRKAWNAAEHETPRSRFTAARGELERMLASLDETTNGDAIDQALAAYQLLRHILGYDGPGFSRETEGHVTRLGTPGVDARPLALIEARPVLAVENLLSRDTATLIDPIELPDHSTLTSVAKYLSTLFAADDAPSYALVFAGRWALLTSKDRWPEGRYLAVDLSLICERNETKQGGEVDRALTCLSAESLGPDADGSIWWDAVRDESVRHTVGVSQDLRNGVRESIEIIANDVIEQRQHRGFEPLSANQANELAKQSLRYLYRILFLLYAEASPELEVLPVGAPEYQSGYSLDRLRDLTLVELTDPKELSGRHLFESLAVLFRLVDSGHQPKAQPQSADDGAPVASTNDGLTFHALRADLFAKEATSLIDEAGLSNKALQEVLRRLLLSKESRGKDRGFISYAELGINQLGAVYEGLMSYTGFFAETDLYEVAKGGDNSKGSWVVPTDRAQGIDENDFVRAEDETTGERAPVIHRRGSFVFRLAGRERQQSASYYTPEVLTKFTVSQALAELLDQDDHTTTAEEILHLTVCEPALGSGAFAIEAVRQLADEYLKRKEKELDENVDPDKRKVELQRIKAYLALHQVYGVDLNATAVELAEISLWLDTMVAGLDAPWFGLHLRRGNSLIGARHAYYTGPTIKSKAWLKATPKDLSLLGATGNTGGEALPDGAIHHFLLPAEGWGAAVKAKESTTLAPDAIAALKAWRSKIKSKPDAKQLRTLEAISRQVEVLWRFALRRLELAEEGVRRAIPLWGRDPQPSKEPVSREAVEESLADANGSYRRLRRIMDAWCALWFWPLTDTTVQTQNGPAYATPPSLTDWINLCQAILGTETTDKTSGGSQGRLDHVDTWDELDNAEQLMLQFAGCERTEHLTTRFPWLAVCDKVAAQQGFFHWELDFATVFARGGFDLQVGNPPWVRPRSDVEALFAEGDPWWQLALKPSEQEKAAKRAATLRNPRVRDLVLDGMSEVAVGAEYLTSGINYPLLAGLQPDTYRCFIERGWSNQRTSGICALLDFDTHYTDESAKAFRRGCYERLRRHWQFINERSLFEIQHQKTFGVGIYGAKREPNFLNASGLYHPETVMGSLRHDGSGSEPGYKDEFGNWDLRPHSTRIIRVTERTLRTWRNILETAEVPVRETRMVYSINQTVAAVLARIGESPRIGSIGLRFSRGWDESIDRKKGRFELAWGAPKTTSDVILQGPHIYVGNPLYKSPNSTMRNQQDWSPVDLESLAPDAIPITSYKPAGDRKVYDASYTHWGPPGSQTSARDYYRIAWRRMAANTGERTLIPAIIPPGAAHVHPVHTLAVPGPDPRQLALLEAVLSSLLSDFQVRTSPKSEILFSTIDRLALPTNEAECVRLRLRALRLNCLTESTADLWRECWNESFRPDSWTGGIAYEGRPAIGAVGPEWTPEVPLRRASDRRQALVEIDALIALALGVTADQLCTVYRTQFAVLYGYDHGLDKKTAYYYDANGRLVPSEVRRAWLAKGDAITLEERTATNPSGNTYVYDPPFVLLDREQDMRQAYAYFESRKNGR